MKLLCKWNDDGTCERCERPRPNRAPENVRRRCRKQAPCTVMTDIALRNGIGVRVYMLRKPCQHLGEKKLLAEGRPLYAKETGCQDPNCIGFTPLYECAEYRRCAPFAEKIEDDAVPIHSCYNCERYLP